MGPSTLVSKTKGDSVIWAIVIILTLMSLLVVYSSTGSLAYKYSKSTESFLFKQFAFIILGVLIIYFAHRVNYTVYSRIAVILFLVSIPLLIFTLIFGENLNSASRWIKLPVINMTIQTSDLAKLALFMYLSRQLSRKQNVIKDFKKGFLPIIIPVGIICVLIAPANLSTAILIAGTSILLMFIGRVNTKHILATIGIAMIPVLLLITIAVSCYDKAEHKSKDLPTILSVGRVPTWIGRIQTFIYSNKEDQNEKLYQINQAKIAIAKGGWMGVARATVSKKFSATLLQRFYFRHYIRRVWFTGRHIHCFYLPPFFIPLHTVVSKMPFCFRCVFGAGVEFYIGDTGYCQYGC